VRNKINQISNLHFIVEICVKINQTVLYFDFTGSLQKRDLNAMLAFWLASLFFNVGWSQTCDTENCPVVTETSYDSKLNCGFLVNDGTDGRSKKCVYLMKTRSKWPESNVFCSSLKLDVNGTEVEVIKPILNLIIIK